MTVFSDIESGTTPIGIVGLGYVGLPLACLLAKKFKVIGFDIDRERIAELSDGVDRTNEVEDKQALLNSNLQFSNEETDLKNCPVVIVAVPTPVDEFKKPDLSPLISASETVGRNLHAGAIVCFESTVYPGVTEDICKAAIEKESGLSYPRDFTLGYSPERVNPGDKEHTIDKIVKVVAATDDSSLQTLEQIYGAVISAGLHLAPSIKTAEAAKVIENIQRDINIGLVNELAFVFDAIGLDTLDVLEAAGTKWNFLKFKPGLVGGHCIGVDPYYLTYLADSIGYHTQLISAGRRINDSIGQFVAQKAVSLLLKRGQSGGDQPKVLIMGATFKEDVPDIRNTRVTKIAEHLENFGVEVFVTDPVANTGEFEEEYGRKLANFDDVSDVDAVIVAVAHKEYKSNTQIDSILKKSRGQPILLDLKGIFDRTDPRLSDAVVWRL